ncbi:MAG: saccharopine dehydrogenase C-terminal domain-containing protein [Bacteroidota bacterium]
MGTKLIGVIGAGMVGSAIAVDMSEKYLVTVADYNKEALDKLKSDRIKVEQIDVRDKESLKEFLSPFDLVICAVPGFLGFETLKTIIEAKKDVVDISFFSEDAFELDELAKINNVSAIVDCGVAPGIGNMILGYYNSTIKVDKFLCLVGGLPKKRCKPFEYKAPFSPVDVIEEYTRPARYIENGVEVEREALSDAEFVDFEEVGTLEAFNTDGLRSLVKTMSHIPNMKEKTLRYPGHIDLIKSLKEGGFFSTEKVKVNGGEFTPLEVTSSILVKAWKLDEKEEEFTIMRIEVEGEERGKEVKHVYNLYDEYNRETNTSSMARTTGYTVTAVANLLLDDAITRKGILPPELIGDVDGLLAKVFLYLKDRGVVYKYEFFGSSHIFGEKII